MRETFMLYRGLDLSWLHFKFPGYKFIGPISSLFENPPCVSEVYGQAFFLMLYPGQEFVEFQFPKIRLNFSSELWAISVGMFGIKISLDTLLIESFWIRPHPFLHEISVEVLLKTK